MCWRRWWECRLLLVTKLSDVSSVSFGASSLQLPALCPLVAPDPAVAALTFEVVVGAALPGTTPSSGFTVLALTFTAIFAFAFSSLATVFASSSTPSWASLVPALTPSVAWLAADVASRPRIHRAYVHRSGSGDKVLLGSIDAGDLVLYLIVAAEPVRVHDDMLRDLLLFDFLNQDSHARFVIDILSRSILVLLDDLLGPFQLMQDIVRAESETKDLQKQSSGSCDCLPLVRVPELSP